MTDFKDDQTAEKSPNSNFKAKILADLKEANRLRQLREEEQLQKKQEERQLSKAQATAEAAEEAAQRLKQRDEVDAHLKKALEEKAMKAKREFVTLSETQKFSPLNLPEESAEKEAELTGETRVFEASQLVTESVSDAVEKEEPAEQLSRRALLETQKLLYEAELLKKAKEEAAQRGLTPDLVFDPAPMTAISEPAAADGELDVKKLEAPVVEKSQTLTRSRKKKTTSIAKRIAKWLISLLVIVLLATAAYGWYYIDRAIKPLDAKDQTYIQVEIPSGSGNKLIGQILEKAGVIKNGQIFNFYTKFKNYTNFQSGYYNFQKSMSLDDIAAALKEGGTAEPTLPVLGKILIKEGYTLKQIAEAVTLNVNTKADKDKTPYQSDAFLTLIQDDQFIAEMVQKYPTLLGHLPDKTAAKYQLEGYLFPATYNYYKETTLREIVEEMIRTMDSKLTPYYEMMTAQNMSVNDVLTLASLVEKEGATDDDRRVIAGVFFNRLNQKMPLQSNIAILYAMDKLGEKITLAEDAGIDTAIDSPYNIYANPGLMPGPVVSPSLSAIKAVLEPQQTEYFYFVADVKTGTVYFARTAEEHDANVEKYINSQLNE